MKNIRLITMIILLLTITNSSLSGKVSYAKSDSEIEAKQLDKRAKILSDYLASYGSPLQYHAQDFIDAADWYGIDWKLAPAISGVESTFGKQSYGYNAWGWGIYGDSRLDFNSWRDGIFTVTGGLKKNYLDRGLTDPYKMNRAYATSSSWGWKVSYFINDLERFEVNQPTKKRVKIINKTAGSSAQLAYSN